MRRRLDTELVRRGLAVSRDSARRLVAQGAVLVNGSHADKAARLVAESDPVVVIDTETRRFVSRGGQKLDAALARFAVEVSGRRCLDAGASTGGFTDCLLGRGASTVVAVDVGHGQLDPRLRRDPRVEVSGADQHPLPAPGRRGRERLRRARRRSLVHLARHRRPRARRGPRRSRRRARRAREAAIRGGAGRGEPGQGGHPRPGRPPRRPPVGGLRLRVTGSHHHGGHGVPPSRPGR